MNIPSESAGASAMEKVLPVGVDDVLGARRGFKVAAMRCNRSTPEGQ